MLALLLAFTSRSESRHVDAGAAGALMFSRSATLNCTVRVLAGSVGDDEIVRSVGCVAAEFSSMAATTRGPSHRAPDRACCTAGCTVVPRSVALVDRGGCSFHQKAWAAQQAGAAAVVVVNTAKGGAAFPMGTDMAASAEQPITIPVVMISHDAAAVLLDEGAQGAAGLPPPVLELALAGGGSASDDSVGFLRHVVPDGADESRGGPTFAHNPRVLVRTELESVSRMARNFHVYVHAPATCRFISKSIIETALWEGEISLRVLECLGVVGAQGSRAQPRVFVDVGANLGWFSLLAAAQGHDVIAIEPMEFNAELLRASVALNQRLAAASSGRKFGSVKLFKTALAESERPPMCVLPAFDGDPTANAGNGQMHPLTPENSARCTDVVNVTTFDALMQRVGVRSVFAIKLDIEGFETLALRGASGQLGDGESRPCFVFVEFWAKYTIWSGAGKLELFSMMFGYGYDAYSMDGKVQVTAALVENDNVQDGDYVFSLMGAPHCTLASMREGE